MSRAMADVGWRPAPAVRSVFESVAHLYVAADPAVQNTVLEAGWPWSVKTEALNAPGVAIWGNAPADGHSLHAMIPWATRRELALRRVLSGVGGFAARDVHRLLPPRRAGIARNALRSALLSGLIVELRAGEDHARVIDAVAQDAGAGRPPEITVRPSRDGSALVRLTGLDDTPFELRVAAIGGRKDPQRNGDALVALALANVPLVPRLYRRGVTAGVSWTSESILDGALSNRLTPRIAADVVELCSALPRAEQVTSLRDRMLRLRDRYPRWAPLAAELANAATEFQPAIVQHGDLWLGNLLVSRGRLSGLFDWDTWHPAGLPGVDLLHLLSMQMRKRTGGDIGALWLRGLWRSPEFLSGTSEYWRRLGVRPTGEFLEAMSLDWWAGQLFRRQKFAARPEWVEQNIDAVLETLNGRR